MAVGAINAEMSPVVLENLLPMAGVTFLPNPLIWIDLFILIYRAGMGIVAGDT